MNFRSAFLKGLVSFCFVTLAAAGAFAQDSKVRSDLSRSFESFDIVRVAKMRTSDTEETLRVKAAGRTYDLRVTPNDLFADNYRAEDVQSFGTFELSRPRVNTYKGKIDGVERSEVRVTVDGSEIVGFFDVSGDRFFVEPAKRYSDSARADQSVVYREKDALTNQSFYCDADLPTRIEGGMDSISGGTANVVLASRRLEVATEADFEYVMLNGSAAAANSNIAGILNMVQGTYASEIDLDISIVYQHTWSSADPFAGANSGAILTAFRAYWNANLPVGSVPRDTAHLFSGKSNILSAGIAFVGAVCSSPTSAYGVSGYVSWAPGKYLIPAHELGHNLGAEHAETAQGCGNTIMNAFLSGSAQMTFCPFSRGQIGNFIAANGSCLTGGGGPTPTPTPTPTATPTPVPTPTVTPTPIPTPTVVPTPTPTPGPTPPCGGRRCPNPTPTPVPSPTPGPTATPTPVPTPTPNPTPTPFPTVTPTPNPLPTPRPRFPIPGLAERTDADTPAGFDFGFGAKLDTETFPVVDVVSFWLAGTQAPPTDRTGSNVLIALPALIDPLPADAHSGHVLDAAGFRESL